MGTVQAPGLSGKVDPALIQQLFMKNVRLNTEVLTKQPRQHGRDDEPAAAQVGR